MIYKYKQINELSSYYNCPIKTFNFISEEMYENEQSFIIANQILSLLDTPDHGIGIIYMEPIFNVLYEYFIDQKKQTKFDYTFVWKPFRCGDYIFSRKTYGVCKSNAIYAFLDISSTNYNSSCAITKIGFRNGFKELAPIFVKILYKRRSNINNLMYLSRLSLCARKIVLATYLTVPVEQLYNNKSENNIILICANAAKSIKTDEGVSLFTHVEASSVVNHFLFGRQKAIAKVDRSTRHVTSSKKRWYGFTTNVNAIIKTTINREDFDFNSEKTEDFITSNDPKDNREVDINIKFPSLIDGKSILDITADGETKFDYLNNEMIEIPPSWFGDPWIAKRQKRGMQEGIAFANSVMPWDRKVISFKGLRCIIKFLFESRDASKIKGILTVIALKLFMGMSDKTISSINCMRIDELENFDEDELKLIGNGKMFFDDKKKAFWMMPSVGFEFRDGFVNTSQIKIIVLPDILHDLIVKSKSISDSRQQQTIIKKVDIINASKCLSTMNDDGINRVTLSRLIYTYRAYFISAAGMPEIWADHIAFEHSYHLLSQHYYITSSLEYLTKMWHHMVITFINSFDGLEGATVSTIMKVASAMTYKTNSDVGTYIGATGTPSTERLKLHFEELWDHFPHSCNEILDSSDDQWNAYIGYVYGALAITTGIRPQRDPTPVPARSNYNDKWVFVEDKYSPHSREARVIPLTNYAVNIMINYEKSTQWISNKMIKNYLGEMAHGRLMIVNPSHCFTVVRPILLDKCLADVVDQRRYLNDIKNGFRHYLLTTLHEHGVPQSDIDFISGHRAASSEPEFLCSPLSWEQTSIRISKVINTQIITKLGLRIPFK